jgi:small-conductance mechanosensitive channel
VVGWGLNPSLKGTMSGTGYFFTDEFYILIGGLGGLTAVFLVLRVLLPHILAKAAARFGIKQDLLQTLNRHVKRALALVYIIAALNLFATVPLIKKYAEPVLQYPILDLQTLRLSIASLVKGVVGFYLLLVMTKIVRTVIRMYLFYKSHGHDVVSTVDILVYNTALVLISMLSLSIIGIGWQVLLPLAGALGIGIGFGFRDIANNFVSGFVILTSRTVKRGDWITLGDNFGRIVDIGIRTTTIRTIDNIDIIIPNSHMISNELINWSYTDNVVRIHVPVGVAYSSDVAKVKNTLLEVAKKSEHVLDHPPPEARFLEFGDSSLNFELLVWVDLGKIRIPMVKSIINYAIWEAFRETGIQVPFPQRDVWFKNELKIEKG